MTLNKVKVSHLIFPCKVLTVNCQSDNLNLSKHLLHSYHTIHKIEINNDYFIES